MNSDTIRLFRSFRTSLLLSVAGAALACACGAADAPETSETEQNAVRAAPSGSAESLAISFTDGSDQSAPPPSTLTNTTEPSTGTVVGTGGTSSGALSAELLSANGSGCPGGPATLVPGATPEAFTLKFPSYSTSLGGGAGVAERRRNCQMLLNVTPPMGYTFTVASASLSGSANLSSGVTARAMVSYHFTGEPETGLSTYQIPSAGGKWSTTGVFAAETLAYAPCDSQRFLAVNTSIALSGQDDPAVKSTAALDPGTTVQLQLRKCQ
ncbi:MAG TPA: DUF4360 domain-containing protein [Polyangiaceae bacterium]|nr:DUF4360 domain-containing protein [Polyangiaceae bacterium]